MTVRAEDIAQPGDPDLDIDIDGVTITSVVAHERELLVHTRGGHGFWISTDGTRADFPPGHPTAQVEDLDLHMQFRDGMGEAFFEELVSRLERWRDQAVLLRLCGAPGRMSTLIEDRDVWVPLPRRTNPSWVE